MDLVSFETIRRTRQKVQAECPELKADERHQAIRDERELEMREWRIDG